MHDGVAQTPSISQHCGAQSSTERKVTKELPGNYTEVPPVTVCMLRSVSKFTVPVQVEDLTVDAILDSAAEVTIISGRVYESMSAPPEKLYDVRLDTAGRQLSMRGFVAGPMKLKIGRSCHEGPVYVAPIEQDMLFGVDIMRKGSAAIDMGRNLFRFKGQEISMNSQGGGNHNPQVARVTVAKRLVIPPNSAAQVRCKMNGSMSDYLIEPIQTEKIYGPRVVRSAGTDPVVCILNCSDRYKLLTKGKEVASATPVHEYLSEGEDDIADANIYEVSKAEESVETADRTVPQHLSEAFNNSTEHLSQHEQVRLAALLSEHEDVFARDQFDLGTFTKIEHGIQTEQAPPVNLQRTLAS